MYLEDDKYVGTTIYQNKTGIALKRGIRKTMIWYHGISTTFDMPGWYADDTRINSMHLPEDLKIEKDVFNELKARKENIEKQTKKEEIGMDVITKKMQT